MTMTTPEITINRTYLALKMAMHSTAKATRTTNEATGKILKAKSQINPPSIRIKKDASIIIEMKYINPIKEIDKINFKESLMTILRFPCVSQSYILI